MTARNLLSNEHGHATEVVTAAAIAIIDDAGRIHAANPAMEAMFGYTSEELALRSLDELLGERRRGAAAAQLCRAMHAGGRAFPVEVTTSPLTVGGGVRSVVVMIDRSATVDLELLFEATFEAVPHGLAIVDRRDVIVRANAELADTLGYTPEVLRGTRLDALLPGLFEDADLRARAVGAPRELTARHSDGREIAVEVGLTMLTESRSIVTLLPRNDADGGNSRRHQRRKANAEIEFAQIASHDLKSPLRGVGDLIEWIAEELGDDTSESVMNNIDRIRTRLMRMDVLIDQLLAYARVGRSVESNQLIDIADLVDDALGLVAVPDSFTVTVDVDVAPFVGSPTPLETVVRNLLANAVKHHDRADGALVVRARAVGQACRIEVIDNGPGIPVADHARVFRLFQTANARPSEHGGLGLAVCRRLCDAHGATIEIDVAPGRGSTFIVDWPLDATRDVNDY